MAKWNLVSVCVLGAGLGLAQTPAAPAQAASAAVPTLETSSDVVEVGRRFRRGVGIGIGVGVLGAIIASEAYRPRAGYYYDDDAYDGPYYYPSGYDGDPRVMCAQNFRSFEWRTGLYTTYGGEKRLCPYLR